MILKNRFVAGSLLALSLSACHSQSPEAVAEPASESKVRDGKLIVIPEKSELRKYIGVTAAQRQSMQVALDAPAVVEADPSKVANILPPVSGRISALMVHLGDAVRVGQPLFTIDSSDLAQARADLQHSEAALTQTKKALSRAKDLAEHHVAAQKDVEQAQADYDNALSEHDRALAVFQVLGIAPQSAGSSRQLIVRSPITGRVSALAAVPGTYANDNTAALMTISDTSTIWFTASVQEKDVVAVKVGEEVSSTVQSYVGESFKGSVAFVADLLDPDTRTVKVRVAYDNHDGRLKPGMFAKVSFAGVQHEAITVPTTALIQNEAQTLVFVESAPWKFEARPVTVGAHSGDASEILTGLNAGERVVSKQGVLLND